MRSKLRFSSKVRSMGERWGRTMGANDGGERWGRSLLTSHARLRLLWRRRLKRRALHEVLYATKRSLETSPPYASALNASFESRVERDVPNVASIRGARRRTFPHLHISEATPTSLALSLALFFITHKKPDARCHASGCYVAFCALSGARKISRAERACCQSRALQ